jgi:hypothetical protein
MGRKVVFFLMILFGLAVGLAYGWWIKPASTADNPLSALRQDYKSDYVLMVAEVYNKDGDLRLASDRLNELEKGTPLQTASNALVYARNAGYSINDLEIISAMVQDLQGPAPQPTGTATP